MRSNYSRYYLLGHRLMELSIPVARKEMIAENTYLLTLDGDIDFQPNAVELLVDLMKKNKNLGAACGRIHPVGSGPMVWVSNTHSTRHLLHSCHVINLIANLFSNFSIKCSSMLLGIGCKRLRSI